MDMINGTLRHVVRLWVGVSITALVSAAAYAGPAESPRMARAKDLIHDEQWARAIVELRAAAADPREPNRDEALFWLAHSQNQSGDLAESVESIRRLERQFPSSRWVKPARSLLIELAQKLRREDVLWWTAAPPPRPAPAPFAPRPAQPVRVPRLAPAAPAAPDGSPAAPAHIAAPAHDATDMPGPPTAWVPDTYHPDIDLRVQALGSLINIDTAKVIPILKKIALDSDNPGAARRAVFVLAHSGKPEAQSTVVEVAKTGPQTVRLAAVRELGRFGGPNVSQALLQVYSSGTDPVKLQVVKSLGDRAETSALLRIAQSEADRELRNTAIITLGRAGGREQLRTLYAKATADSKRPIIIGLFSARAEEELIRIARQEKDPNLRREALRRLRLMGTPKAKAYLEKLNR
jgi:HEAT repeat protein